VCICLSKKKFFWTTLVRSASFYGSRYRPIEYRLSRGHSRCLLPTSTNLHSVIPCGCRHAQLYFTSFSIVLQSVSRPWHQGLGLEFLKKVLTTTLAKYSLYCNYCNIDCIWPKFHNSPLRTVHFFWHCKDALYVGLCGKLTPVGKQTIKVMATTMINACIPKSACRAYQHDPPSSHYYCGT